MEMHLVAAILTGFDGVSLVQPATESLVLRRICAPSVTQSLCISEQMR